jgi:hypothetical protein
VEKWTWSSAPDDAFTQNNWEADMLERLVLASEAMRAAGASLLPAMSGCRNCGTMRVIASPVLGVCPDCGDEFTVLPAESSSIRGSGVPEFQAGEVV